ncbi:MAG TPA: DUF3775 domain-containing protein [Rhizomicrobium sp.]|nr:DUF3775 domain-containing protein [Rhizomicrobium sp.]
MLQINPEKVRHIVTQARMFDSKEGDSDPDSGSNATDDGMADVLEDQPDDATQQELAEYIRGLDIDEQVELVALAWVGRGTYDPSDWDDAVAEARRAHNKRTAEYLFSLPMLGDYLEEGLAQIEDGEEAEESNEDSGEDEAE